MSALVRVAVVQSGAVLFDTAACIERVRERTRAAASEGAQLVVFPEAFVGGYPKGMDFGVKIGARSPEGREQFRRYHAGAMTLDEAGVAVLGDIAKESGVELVVGVIERAASTLYCTVVFLGPDGALRARHRKTMPTALERLVWGYGEGPTVPVVETGVGRVGAAICWENYMPLLRASLYAQRVELYCAPTADDRETWLPTVRHIALEGRCFVLSACQHLRVGDLPEGYPAFVGDDPNRSVMRGGSCIVGPLGAVVAGPVFDADALLVADLDLDDMVRARLDLDVAGHSSRPDLFQLVTAGKTLRIRD